MCAFCCTCQLDSECVKAPVHYWHNGLHGGSHSDGMSAVGPFCVVHTQVHQVWSMSLTSSPLSSPLSTVPRCFISQGSFTASTLRWNSTA